MRWVSTMGDSALTVTVSVIAPTFNSTFTGAVKPVVSSMPSADGVETGQRKGHLIDTWTQVDDLVLPFFIGRRRTTRSMSAGLFASTVTPGMTAPVVSFTTPAMAPVWATAIPGMETRMDKTAHDLKNRIRRPSSA